MVKCKNCGAEIPDGEVRCPVCGKMVQLVPDFDTTALEAEKHEKDKAGEDASPEKEAEKSPGKKKKHPAAAVLQVILGTALAGAVFFGEMRLVSHFDSGSYSYQKLSAERLLNEGKYDEALSAVRRADELKKSSADTRTLEARILAEKGEFRQAENILTELINSGTYDDDTISALADLYAGDGNEAKIAPLLKDYGNADLAEKYSAYVSEAPTFSLTDGNTYVYGTKLVLSGNGSIYYTLDGSTPNESSIKYNGAIILPEGNVTVKAIAVNDNNIVSDVSSASYTIVNA